MRGMSLPLQRGGEREVYFEHHDSKQNLYIQQWVNDLRVKLTSSLKVCECIVQVENLILWPESWRCCMEGMVERPHSQCVNVNVLNFKYVYGLKCVQL